MTRSICSRRSASVWRATGIAAVAEAEEVLLVFVPDPFVPDPFEPEGFFFSGSVDRLTGI